MAHSELVELQKQMDRIEAMVARLLGQQGVDAVPPTEPVPISSFRARANQAIAETEAREERKKQKSLRQ